MTDSTSPSLVVIGSSAGGIEALSALISSLPTDFPAPIIVAQHLHPDRPSRLSEILGSRSNLPVQPITDHHDLVNGTIYIVVPNTHIAISDSDVRVVEDGPRPMPSIDLLFQTAADVYQDNLIAVILSGTGSDGTEGVRAVKEKHGQVIIKDDQRWPVEAVGRPVPDGTNGGGGVIVFRRIEDS